MMSKEYKYINFARWWNHDPDDLLNAAMLLSRSSLPLKEGTKNLIKRQLIKELSVRYPRPLLKEFVSVGGTFEHAVTSGFSDLFKSAESYLKGMVAQLGPLGAEILFMFPTLGLALKSLVLPVDPNEFAAIRAGKEEAIRQIQNTKFYQNSMQEFEKMAASNKEALVATFLTSPALFAVVAAANMWPIDKKGKKEIEDVKSDAKKVIESGLAGAAAYNLDNVLSKIKDDSLRNELKKKVEENLNSLPKASVNQKIDEDDYMQKIQQVSSKIYGATNVQDLESQVKGTSVIVDKIVDKHRRENKLPNAAAEDKLRADVLQTIKKIYLHQNMKIVSDLKGIANKKLRDQIVADIQQKINKI